MLKRVIGAAFLGLWLSGSSMSIAQITKESTKAPELSKESKVGIRPLTCPNRSGELRVSAASKTIQMPSSVEARW
jgi:hypothetical protein